MSARSRRSGGATAASWSAAQIADLVARKAVRLEELERDVSVLFPGAADAIRRAAAAMPIAIASGARGEEIRRVLDREHLHRVLHARSSRPKTRRSASRRPIPICALWHSWRRRCGGRLLGAECVAIEDSHWGLESARAAGLRTVAVTNTYRGRRADRRCSRSPRSRPWIWISCPASVPNNEFEPPFNPSRWIQAASSLNLTPFRLYTLDRR